MNISLDTYASYFEDIATRLTDIQHGVDGRESFLKWDVTAALDGNIEGVSYSDNYALMLDSYEKTFQAPHHDQVRNIVTGGFQVIRTVPFGDQAEKTLRITRCEKITDQIIAQILQDMGQGKIVDFLDENSIQTYEIGSIGSNTYGWRCEFRFRKSFNFTIDQSFWI